MIRKLVVLLAVVVIAGAAAAPVSVAARKLPPTGSPTYCCTAFLELRPPRYWNGKIIERPLPLPCRCTCGRICR